MSKTRMNLDAEALSEAAKILGTKSKTDTVNEALRSLIRQQRQLEMLERASRDGTFADVPRGDEAWH